MSRETRRPKIIDLYILKEIMVPTGIGMGIFTFIFLVSKLFRITEMVVEKGIPVLYAIKLFLCLIPAFLVFVAPMSLLLGILTALARLSADNEIIALKTSGVGLYRLSPPVIFLSVITFLFTTFLVFYAVPWGSQNFRETLFQLAGTQGKLDVKERIFNAPFGDLVIYVNKVSQREKMLEGIMIYDERDPQINSAIVARRGYLTSDPKAQKLVLNLFDGSIHSQEVQGETYRTINFNTYQFTIFLKEEMAKERKRARVRMLEKEMSISDLREKIKGLRERGQNIRPQLVELHFKFAIPFGALIFGLVGLPLGVQRTQSGRSWGFVLCAGIFLLYYVLYCLGKNLGVSGIISPFLAAWFPNILFGALGIYLFVKTAQESPLRILSWVDKGMEFLREQWKRFFRVM
ncbi:MAG: LPS export ABC transporter permease LptF [Deltaproteobacteria bacterium RBG_13_52_11]|nr:MAG: LPS export ABC transporter permease LptF [Deltaproteobacteria bacterium RBG_13_52_11]